MVPHTNISVNKQTAEHYFVTNLHRLDIWREFTAFENIVKKVGIPVTRLWLDGSFISQRQYPADVDVVAYVEYDFRAKNYGYLTNISGRFTKLHVIWIGLWQTPDSMQQAINELEIFNWLTWFNTDANDLPKGFIELNW